MGLFHLRFSSIYIHNDCYFVLKFWLLKKTGGENKQFIIRYLYADAQHHLSFSTTIKTKSFKKISTLTDPFFIFRLKKTWSLLSRRDKQTFDRLYDLFSEEANFEELRKHVDQLAFSPVKDCIPYLGIYLTDLTYIGKFNVVNCNPFV